MYTDGTEPWLLAVPDGDDFSSPFPSTFSDARLSALGGMSEAVLAKRGATAWADATQICLKQKAIFAGDLRSDWLTRLVKQDPVGGQLTGIFAGVNFEASTDAATLKANMAATGFDLANNILTAVPVYGQVLSAVLGAARFFFKLGQDSPEVQKVIVPWAEYSRDLDEDFARTLFVAVESVDWTQVFWPALAWDKVSFRMLETEEGDDTRAWGTFSTSGKVQYTSSAPGGLGGAGFGFMPGTQRLADVVQMKIGGIVNSPTGRKDAITHVGDFFPATAQTCTALWEMVAKAGNPDMFKVRAGELGHAWRGYFDNMRAAFANQWNQMFGDGDTFDGPINLGKIASSFLLRNGQGVDLAGLNGMLAWPGMTRKSGAWQPDPNDGRPGCLPKKDRSGSSWWPQGWSSDIGYQAGVQWPPSRCQGVDVNRVAREASWRWMDQAIISPACLRLKQAQHRALYRTEICAYVRPRALSGLAAYGAFLDESPPINAGFATFGEELTARCEHAREVLLTRDLRYKVRILDVDAIDPVYAAKLRATGVDENSWKRPIMKMSAGPAIEETPDMPPSDGPQGGSPFGLQSVSRGGGGGIIAGALALGLFAALAKR